jgi:hypothetical protein
LDYSFARYWKLDTSEVNAKYLGSFEMRCRRRMAKISWTDHVRSEEVLRRVKEKRNILIRKTNWSGHMLRRNCLLIHVIERYKGQEDEEEDVSSYWMTLKEVDDTGN